ncbi:hypothetical protein ASPZODRAFT_130868 [Penicilliopsis zonata CBS 506.65]|uniref:Zn(2)-C6 fungal-type domain-containing protein n=1 Tax=Penicilliopsis zonata CBS 506.65 TaxID=1073090 RepID=A0A1L9SNR7_9EURO|nr:hypothetical protein ASPZODRAFT_130868 [Penicilliopsis zonata CBS 506.65]OJJ48751.1 hypothetical protein ASPZODRAFT_130868 [Penicilliopsis zonata CBS 506.65]
MRQQTQTSPAGLNAGAGADESTPRRAKRPRAAQACDRCRLKKYKCDELYPCSQCKKSKIDCIYQGNYRQWESTRSASYVVDLERKVDELNAKLRTAGPDETTTTKTTTTTTTTPPATYTHNAVSYTSTSISQAEATVPAGVEATPTSLLRTDSTTPREQPVESTTDAITDELSELNHHTNGIEFHGSTSSAAFLGHLQRSREPKQPPNNSGGGALWNTGAGAGTGPGPGNGTSININTAAPETSAASYSLISTLHNPAFSPSNTVDAPGRAATATAGVSHDQNYYFEQAHVFMNGYFENIHFIHPLIDKEDFLLRAHGLWFNHSQRPDASFVALYLSVLSFGALVRVWDEEKIAGLGRFEWSRKLFAEAQLYLDYLRFSNDLETVQCLYLMAKICQNELNPNLAYMYLGLAVRTCLSAGFNREIRNPKDQRSGWISKTWWGLFSLEIEMSFSVGRPDTLGMDEYHNRALPARDNSEYAIIPWMVDFAQIIRRVSVQVYHSRIALHEKLQLALQIEEEMDQWLVRLPDRLKPDILHLRLSRDALRDPKWARRQRLVLGIRYYNVKMLLFRPFLSYFSRKLRHTPVELEETISKCLDAAMKTIEVIYDIYRIHTFFRCWWYNTTYVMFATSTLLLPISKLGVCDETAPFLRSIEMAVDILDAMEESVVARKSVEIIKHYLTEFQHPTVDDDSQYHSHTHHDIVPPRITAEGQEPAAPVFDLPEWAYGFGFPDSSFDGIARLFDDLQGLPVLDNP